MQRSPAALEQRSPTGDDVGGRTWWQVFRDRTLASDPGLVRLISAGRAVLAIATALGLEYLLAGIVGGSPLIPLMLGAVLAMLSAFGVLDPTRGGQAVTMLCLPLFLLAGMGLALAVDRYRALSLAMFVVVVFAAVFIRRFGPRFFICGMVGFMGYFFALFLGLRPEQLPGVLPSVAVAVVWVVLLMVVLLPIRNDRVLRRMIRSFEVRLSDLAEAAARLATSTPDTRGRAERRMRSRMVRLNETALMIDGQLGAPSAVVDDSRARTVRRAVFDGELAASALVDGVGLLAGDDPGTDPAVRDLLDAVRHGHWTRLEALAGKLAADDGTSVAVRRLAVDAVVLAEVRAEWSGAAARREPAEGPEFEPAVQLFGGNLPGSAPTVQRLHDPEPDSDAGSDTGSVTAPARPRRLPRLSLTTRQAIQAAVATAAAVAVGDALSTQRYYWAVLAALIAFTGTTTVAETVRKSVHRVVGTLVGLLAAIPLVPLIGTNVAVVLPVILLSVFGAFYLFRISYAVMIFFITLMLGELYALLGSFTLDLMILRLGETAAGGAIGCLVAVLVLPTRTRAADREARRGLFTALAGLLDAVDLRLRRAGAGDDLAAAARALDAALHQALLIGRPLSRTWMVTPNPSGVRRLTGYTALAHHARHLARTVDRYDGRSGDGLTALTGACSRLRGVLDARDPEPGELGAVIELLVPLAGSAGDLAPLAREVGLLVAELETLSDRSPSGPDDRAPTATGRICGPDHEPVAATVTLVDPAGAQTARATTDEDGRFTVAPATAGTYLLVVAPRSPEPAAAPHGEFVRLDRDVVLPDVLLRAPVPTAAAGHAVATVRRRQPDLGRVPNPRPGGTLTASSAACVRRAG